jgi:hypothetical protein
MKEKLIVLLLASASFIGLNAQVKGQALGVRLGTAVKFPITSIEQPDRIEGDLDFITIMVSIWQAFINGFLTCRNFLPF